jgi:hypothetical protein
MWMLRLTDNGAESNSELAISMKPLSFRDLALSIEWLSLFCIDRGVDERKEKESILVGGKAWFTLIIDTSTQTNM